jgi:hypothetical protein
LLGQILLPTRIIECTEDHVLQRGRCSNPGSRGDASTDTFATAMIAALEAA